MRPVISSAQLPLTSFDKQLVFGVDETVCFSDFLNCFVLFVSFVLFFRFSELFCGKLGVVRVLTSQ